MVTVIKIGGSLMAESVDFNALRTIIDHEPGSCVIVHGGGPSVSRLCERLGISPSFVTSPGGIRSRYTDMETMKAFIMAMRGQISTDIVTGLQKAGVRAAGISGTDGPTLVAERKRKLMTAGPQGRRIMIEGGYTGKITRADPDLIVSILNLGIIPVVSPIAISTEFEPLNIDGDRAAAAIAGALKADRLLLLTNVDGVILEDKVVHHMTLAEVPSYMERVGNGMDRKLMSAGEALQEGCMKVIILNGEASKIKDYVENKEVGTVISP